MHSESAAVDLPESAITRVTPADTARWIDKAQSRIEPLRKAISATGGRSRRVTARVSDPSDAAFGSFMLSWLVPQGEDVELNHLPDGRFFLRLLRLAYRPLLDREPDLRLCLLDGSRLELAFTNDVLQAQAAGPLGSYSMVRHHALVLHAATRWLDDPARGRWLRIYEECANGLVSRRSMRPSVEELAGIEASAFADFAAYADDSRDPAAAAALLADPQRLRNAIDYQIVAAAAIGLLERDWRARGGGDWVRWMTAQLGAATSDEYLLEQWQSLR